jgi:pimeloyl-ACP methyl ester carboxylesterase
MKVIRDPAVSTTQASPLVLLPGAYMHAADFVSHDIVGSARKTGHFAEIVAVETGMDAYLDRSIVGCIHETVETARTSTAGVWLGGISLGGLGALLYAKAHPEAVAGLLLLSPFIGTRGAVTKIGVAGGFAAWEPPTADANNAEQRFLRWLKSYHPTDTRYPKIYLGYGEDDRFAAFYRLLEDILPAGRVVTVAGGHDWETWTVLWTRLLRLTSLHD